ncbi:UNVERIFIED_CONTAM: polynucleotide adenylyltransferase [Siphonaria sp. JEL0065]|nr:polynucleotide adenylyltransferase [Siphonaria sp. JEL0065]
MQHQLHQHQKYPGITDPLSKLFPTPSEIAVTDALVSLLRERDQYETEEEAQKREIVLGKLDTIFKEFVRKISLKRNLPESMANEAGGKIFTFGSYRLGVHGKASDIDTLCVAPKHVQREDFFTDMLDVLKARPEVASLAAVTDAYVPVITFEFSGIEIDLLCASLAVPSVPDDLDLSNDNLLKNLDEKCVRSLNGSRVTDDILRLVPNVDTFRTALRCIKLWAKNRGIYSNVMGFFGGVAWAIAVARICQLYPNAAAGVVVNKFFNIMGKWNWPQPVLLRQIADGPLSTRVWNPKLYPGDRAHLVPIITPAYPSMCSTHNMTPSTKQVTIEEFARGTQITERILVGTATWAELMEKSDFFGDYKYYLQIIASSDTEERQLKWSGWVESRLRQLVMKLESSQGILLAHPYIKSFQRVTKCKNDEEGIQAAHGNYPKVAEQTQPAPTTTTTTTTSTTSGEPPVPGEELSSAEGAVAVSEPAEEEGSKTVYTSTFYIGLKIEGKEKGMNNQPRKIDISWPTSEFVSLVKAWDKYEEATMGVVVQHIKCDKLPAELMSSRAKKRPRGAQKGVNPAIDRAVKRVKTDEDANGSQPVKRVRADDESEACAAATAATPATPADVASTPIATGDDSMTSDLPVEDNTGKAEGGEENGTKMTDVKSDDKDEVAAPALKQNYSGLGSGFQSSGGLGGIKVKLASKGNTPVKESS